MVDRLFTCDFGSEVFGLFLSLHNKRALDPEGPWRRLTLAIAYATAAHLFITDLNQSPFNLGTRVALEDFNFEQVAELNHRYGSPLGDQAEVARYYRLIGGYHYLGYQEMPAVITLIVACTFSRRALSTKSASQSLLVVQPRLIAGVLLLK